MDTAFQSNFINNVSRIPNSTDFRNQLYLNRCSESEPNRSYEPVIIEQVSETWLSWNGKRVQSESCKHGKKGKSSESSKNRERQSASTMRRSSARAARPARASKRQSNTIAYALAQPLRGLAGRGAHCSAAKAASLAR